MESASRHVESLELDCEVELIVRIYCNLEGLDDVYHKRCILSNANRYESFVRGLNKSNPLLDVIDAGNGKECADSKIRRKSPQMVPVQF